ncbi:MAG: AsmA family protein [Spirochaetes bacterium]|nr:AsmA family protein [Spirochaetota bacterium]
MKPAKICKVFALAFSSLLLLLVIGILLFIRFYPAENIRRMVTTQAESALGRKVTIGDIGYGFGSVSLDNVVLHESDESSPVLLSVGRADLMVSLVSLFRMELNFSAISLKNTRCNIVFDGSGVSNIQRFLTGLPKTGGPGVSAKISKIILEDAEISLSNPPPYLAPLAGEYRANAAILIQDNILIQECTLQLPEKRGTLLPELSIRTLKDNFEIAGTVTLENAALPWVYRWGNNVTLPYNVVNGTVVDLLITKHFVRGNVKATCTLLNSPKLLRADGFCNVSIKDRTVFIGKTRGGIENSTFYIDGLLFTFEGRLIRFDIREIAAQVSDVVPILKFMPPRLFGRVDGNLRYEDGLYNGRLSAAGCGYDRDLKIVSDLTANITISNNLFKATGIPFRLYGNPCALSIASTEQSLSRLFINIGAEKIVIDPATMSFIHADAPINLPVEITGLINAGLLQYETHRFTGIQLQYRLAGSSLAINGFQFIYADGKISGSGAVSTGQGAPQASLELNIANLLIQNAISFNEKIRNRFFGQVNGKASVDFELSRQILDTARGHVEFTIDRGKLVDTGIQDGLGLLLSELKYKLRDLEFNRIYGNIDIRGTNYLIHSFIFNSNDVRLKITGTFDKQLNANPLNITLEFTREFIRDLPGVITLGLNKYLKGNWYIMPFTQTGDMMNGKNVRRAD